MSKIITFAVPCYNSAAYMDHCVQTLLSGGGGCGDYFGGRRFHQGRDPGDL